MNNKLGNESVNYVYIQRKFHLKIKKIIVQLSSLSESSLRWSTGDLSTWFITIFYSKL